MAATKPIYVLYIIYNIYIFLVLGATNLSLLDVVPAIVLLWVGYLFFHLGGNVYDRKERTAKFNADSFDANASSASSASPSIIDRLYSKTSFKILIVVASALSSIYCAKYYVGIFPKDVISSYLNNIPIYYIYQTNMAANDLATFRFSKLPYIVMRFFTVSTFLVSWIYVFKFLKVRKISDILFITLVALCHVYFGLARGTNIELFQVFIMAIYLLITGNDKHAIRNTIVVLAAGSVMVYIYYQMLAFRGVINLFSSDTVQYNPSGWVSVLSPSVSHVLIGLFGYIGFGFQYISLFIQKILFSSAEKFVAFAMPGANILFGNNYIRMAMAGYIDIGAKWVPDCINIIGSIGLLGFLVLCFSLGMIAKSLTKHNELAENILLFLIYFEMVSMPVGNWVFNSSAMLLLIASVIVALIYKSNRRGKVTQGQNDRYRRSDAYRSVAKGRRNV